MKITLSFFTKFCRESQLKKTVACKAVVVTVMLMGIAALNSSSAQSSGDYRTRTGASGSWFSNSIWQRYSGGSWSNVATTPTSSDGAIEIRSDASITVPSALTVDQLTVNGTLNFNNSSGSAGSSFTLNNGSGTDMVINGTFLNTAAGNFATLAISGSATWSVSNGGTYVHNSQRAIAAALTAATFAASSNFEYRGTGSLIPAISLSGITYGNLSFTSTSGSYSIIGAGLNGMTVNGNFSVGTGVSVDLSAITGTKLLAGNVSLAGSLNPFAFTVAAGKALIINAGGIITNAGFITYAAGSTLIYNTGGTFNRSNEWTATSGAGYPSNVQISNNTLLNLGSGGTGTARQCSGNLIIDAGSTLSMNVSGTAMTAALTVAGNITLNGTLTLSGTSGGNLNVGGNWVAAGSSTFTPNSRVVTFNGTNTQTVSKASGTANFGALTINKSPGTLNLAGDVSVSNTLTLTAGIVSIGSNTLTLNGAVSRSNGSIAGAHTSSLVIGGTAGSLYFDQTGTNNYLKNFTVNTAASATLSNALNITGGTGANNEGTLTVSGTGVLTTGGNLTIKSNNNGTARVAQGSTTGGYISGNVTVERFIPQNASKAWRLLASNTSGQTIKQSWQENQSGFNSNANPGFGTMIPAKSSSLTTAQANGFDSISRTASLFKYNPSTDNLDAIANTNSTQLGSEHGYFIFIRGDRSANQFGAGSPSTSTVLRSKGTLFQGNQAAVSVPAGQYALVRNPYASRIDMRQVVRTGGLVDAYQVWDPKLAGAAGVGGYQTFTKNLVSGNYEIAPGGGSYGAIGTVQNFIESGSAFFVQAPITAGTVRVLESCKASGSQLAQRPSTPAGGSRLLFSCYAKNTGSTDLVDGGYVDFDDAYSNAVDIYDVRKSPNFGENFGMLRNNTDLVVERRKSIAATDSIFFKMTQLRKITYQLDFSTVGFDAEMVTAVLEDKYTGVNTTLDLSATTSYSFTVDSAAASAVSNRFRIVFSVANTFTGNGNWTDSARWSAGAPPVSGAKIIIATGANAILNTNLEVAGSMVMDSNSKLVINPSKTLSVATSGMVNFYGESVTFKSDNTGYGSLGQVNGTLNGATNVTVERYIPNNGFRSWRLLSVPTYGNGQTIRNAWQEGAINPLPLQNNLAGYGTQITGVGNITTARAAGFDTTSATASLFSWSGSAWSPLSSTNLPIANIKAYFLYLRGDRSIGVSGGINNTSSTTLRTNGTVYTGDQVNTVGANAFALIPNVYPSAINFTGLTRTGGVSNLFYVWDSKKQNGSSLGAYQTFSATNGFMCLLSGGSYAFGQSNTTIESGQAFFVQSTTAGTITLKETAKISGSNGNLGFRPSATPAKIDSRLFTADNEMLDANAVVFDAAYNKAVDGDDAPKMGNPGANFAVETYNKLLVIEGRGVVTDNDVIQFRMWNLQQQSYKLELAASNIAIPGFVAMFEDSYLHSSTPLNLEGTTTVNFTVDATAASSAANRFRIVFKQSAVLPVSFVSVSGSRSSAGIKVDWKVAAERNVSSYQLERSTDGIHFSVVSEQPAIGNTGTDIAYSLTDASVPQAAIFYRIKSTDANGAMKYSIAIKVAAAYAQPGFAVLPSLIDNGVINLQFKNQAAGKYSIRLLSNSGQVSFNKIIYHSGADGVLSIALPSACANGIYQLQIQSSENKTSVEKLVIASKD